ncbi:MAG: NAD(P)H-dependent oxidoreductase [Roseitalea sp.]|jgi:FMN-dependent NADH-azoreductase|nr:NAD(P)H-dependent oxidoreductase [Roseitalea sp.]MBO6723687.1 NAD(P)H-dependent oxidoreductase [Roseitalea sp.]MBO6744028.1 NAD(P)H-dependent oxidoreductase [Roseitalea sp.]
MAHILSVQSSARDEGSHSRALSAELVEALGGAGANMIVERDLSEPVPQLDEKWLGANWTPVDARSGEQARALALSDTLISELEQADTIIIGAPVYNFSVPAALKAWIDQIARAGRTFRYSENGPQGLLEGKRAFLVITSGGVPVDSPVDFATPYMRQVLRFIGITEVTVIAADRLVQNADDSLAGARTAIANAAGVQSALAA